MATMILPSRLVGPVRKATSLMSNRPTPGPRKSLMVVLGFFLCEALQDLDEGARHRRAAMRAAVRHGQRPCHAPRAHAVLAREERCEPLLLTHLQHTVCSFTRVQRVQRVQRLVSTYVARRHSIQALRDASMHRGRRCLFRMHGPTVVTRTRSKAQSHSPSRRFEERMPVALEDTSQAQTEQLFGACPSSSDRISRMVRASLPSAIASMSAPRNWRRSPSPSCAS